MSRSFPYDFPDTGCHAPGSTMTDNRPDIVIAQIPAGTLLTQKMVDALIEEHMRVNRRTLGEAEAREIIQRNQPPAKPRDWWLITHGDSVPCTSCGFFPSHDHATNFRPSDNQRHAGVIHVREVLPDPQPRGREWWFIKDIGSCKRYGWTRHDIRQENVDYLEQVHVREIP